MNIELKMNRTAGENADDYFGMSKRIKDKLSRVKLEPEKVQKRAELKKVKRVFTNYRWFISGDGNFVIAGKGAISGIVEEKNKGCSWPSVEFADCKNS